MRPILLIGLRKEYGIKNQWGWAGFVTSDLRRCRIIARLLALDRIGGFMNRLAATAEQLSVEAVWALILSAAFVKWLRGKVLQPVSQGGKLLFRLLT